MPKLLIGLLGFARVGKDSCANALDGFERRAFANGVREVAQVLNPWLHKTDGSFVRYCDLVSELGYDCAKSREPAVRQELVQIGHGFRKIFGDDVWVQQTLKEPLPACLVLSDVRYENEVRAIKERGGFVIRIERTGVLPANATEAETIPRCASDFTFHNDGPLEMLSEDFNRFLQESGIFP